MKTFGIDQDKRKEVTTGLRRTGVTGGGGIKDKFFNQLLFEINQDYIIGTASQLTTGDATLKYLSSDQTLRDKDNSIVVLNDGDRVYIIGLDMLTADFDLSAYDRLGVVSDPSITLANGSWDLKFGDSCRFDLIVADKAKITVGTISYGTVNGGLIFRGESKGIFAGLEAQVWRMVNDTAGGTETPAGPLEADWGISDDNVLEIGAQLPTNADLMSRAQDDAGDYVFKMRTTGYYLYLPQFGIATFAADSSITTQMRHSNDNNVSSSAAINNLQSTAVASVSLLNGAGFAILKISDIVNDCLYFNITPTHGSTVLQGVSTSNFTSLTVIKLADL